MTFDASHSKRSMRPTRPYLRIRATLAVLSIAALLGACATGGGGGADAPAGPTAEELIETTVMTVLEELQAGNIEGVIAAYTDDFTWDQGDKASYQAFLEGAAQGGFLDGMSANTEEMVVTVDGDMATVSGLTIEGAFGLLDLTFDLANRAGRWLVTKQSQQ